MEALIEMPGTALTRPAAKKAIALINATLTDLVDVMETARLCDDLFAQAPDNSSYLGRGVEEKFLDRAKIVHGYLWQFAYADAAYTSMLEILRPRDESEITQATANKMLSVLFGTLTKKKADTDEMLLAACADMFDPLNDMLGKKTGLWKPVCKHPVVLALAIKKLIATSVFAPTPSELREAMETATQKLQAAKRQLGNFLAWMIQADKIVFAFDRAAWEAAYARLDSRGPLAMVAHSDYGNQEGDGERCAALEKIWEPKHEAEEAAELAAEEREKLAADERGQLAAPPERKQIAAAKKRNEAKRSAPPLTVEEDDQ
jgi:hypothetical protein